MENLVRRLGRIFSRQSKQVERGLPARTLQRMDRLEKSLVRWVDGKGWRVPVRTVGEAAERLGTDSETLYYYFRQRVGLDFRTWRTRLRLEDAMRLLREEPDTPAVDIAARVGFSNRSNFSRQFLAYTGLTPLQWRASTGSANNGKAGVSHDIPAPENDYA